MPIEMENVEEIIEKFETLIEKATLEKNMQKACALVEASARENAPKGSGDLKRSIESRVESNETEVKGIIFSPLEYAPYVEFGTGIHAEGGKGRQDVPWVYQADNGKWYATSGMYPHPYMRPALHENREEIKRILKEGMTK